MSRRKFPRVAPRTRRRQSKRQLVKLPPLRYAIYGADGELHAIHEIVDSRARVCNTFNEMMASPGPSQGSYALPITDDSEVVAPRRRRKAVANG